MNPSRPYDRYGYYSNTNAPPPPIENFDDSISVTQSSGYGERRDFSPSSVDHYSSNSRQDNPFTPHTRDGADTYLRSAQEYGERGYLPNRPAEIYKSNTQTENPFLSQRSSVGGGANTHYSQGYVGGRDFPNRSVEGYNSNLRSDNPFLARQPSTGGSAQFQTSQGYGEYSEPSYSPVQDYRQRSGYDQMESSQSRPRYRTIYPRPDRKPEIKPEIKPDINEVHELIHYNDLIALFRLETLVFRFATSRLLAMSLEIVPMGDLTTHLRLQP
ncbi:hypothetical protein FPOA_02268 [Fusarium poae]|uniref:Uncharacterized protein n=1 Tax=Fusarium poae TaxID=36050 RepID=A0A1B8B6H5_FUSPO|nr:hypothetical protein FPOA_02268 [Fusarium poae]